MQKKVIIIGAGGHGRVLADIILRRGDRLLGFLDDAAEGTHILGKTADAVAFPDAEFIIGIGDNAVRRRMAENFPDLPYYTAVDPSAVLSPSASLGKGACVMPGAVINAGTKVGNHTIINTHATVEHDCRLEDFVHISPGAVLCGGVSVGRGTHVGAGAAIRNGISVIGGSTIGAGAAVVKNLNEPGVYVGVPARKMK